MELDRLGATLKQVRHECCAVSTAALLLEERTYGLGAAGELHASRAAHA